MLELFGLEDDQDVGDRVRPDRPVAETVDLDAEFLIDRGAHPFGDRAGLFRVVIDVRVITQVLHTLPGRIAHAATSGPGAARRRDTRIVAQTAAIAHQAQYPAIGGLCAAPPYASVAASTERSGRHYR